MVTRDIVKWLVSKYDYVNYVAREAQLRALSLSCLVFNTNSNIFVGL